MADYSAYLPVTPPASTFLGLSPEEQAQLAQYRTPDNVGRIHPMGGQAIAGRQRYQEGMGQYLDAVLQGNELRQKQMQMAMRNSLQEAGINQMGRIMPELIRSGDSRLAAGSLFAGDQLPGLTNDQGQPSDMSIEADTNARLLKQGEDMKNVAQAGLANVQAGFEPETEPFAKRWGLPLTKNDPLALRVAREHTRAAALGGGGAGKPTGYTTYQYLDQDPSSPTYNQVVTRRANTYGNPQTTVAPPPPTTANPASFSSPGTAPPGYIPVHDEELTEEQVATVQSQAVDAQSRGYMPTGIYTAPDGTTVLRVQNGQGQHIDINLDEAGSDTGEGTSD